MRTSTSPPSNSSADGSTAAGRGAGTALPTQQLHDRTVAEVDEEAGGSPRPSRCLGVSSRRRAVDVHAEFRERGRWEVSACPGTDSDRTPAGFGPALPPLYANLARLPADQSVFDAALTAPLAAEPLPSYPSGPVCNVRGLTPLGEYLIDRMIDEGMMIEADHLSVRARAQVMTILESRGYSGVITSHGWADDTSRARIQALGGFVAPYASTTHEYIAEWREARASHSTGHLRGFGFGTDTNGLGKQAAPRPGAVTDNPVTYPFTSFDGGRTIHQSRWGTRLWDFNRAGASHYGLFVDWIEDLKHVAGQEIVDDLADGAEAYLQMWERAAAR